MVIIRLERRGKTNSPFYRIVATDERKKIGGSSLETLGFWNPHSNEKEIKKDLIEKWVKKGAKISPAVKKLMSK
jgi:small subunit ribosomal protein S16